MPRSSPSGIAMMVQREDGKHEALDLSRLADRHIRPGWVRTIHSAQGATADRVMAHLESFRANTVDAPAVYNASTASSPSPARSERPSTSSFTRSRR